MECVMLLTRDRELHLTKKCKIYTGENLSSVLKILVPAEYERFTPVLQVILPNGEGKIRQCTYESEQYNGLWKIQLPIKSVLTQISGVLKMWLTFFGDQNELIKSGYGELKVEAHKGFGAELDGDGEYESVDIVEQLLTLKADVATIRESTVTNIVLDDTAHKLQYMSGDAVLGEVALPNDISWEVIK